MGQLLRLLAKAPVPPTYLPTSLGTPYAARGMMRMIQSYTGALAQGMTAAASALDIGYAGDNTIDKAYAAANSLVTAHKVYDQSGNGRDYTNNGTDTRPRIITDYPLYRFMPLSFAPLTETVVIPNQTLQTVNTLSLSSQNVTHYMVCNPKASINASNIFEFRAAAARAFSGFTVGSVSGLYTADAGFSIRSTSVWPVAKLSVIAVVANASNINIYLRGQKIAGAAYSALTLDQIVLGLSTLGYHFLGDWAGDVTYAAAHNDTEVATMTAALQTIFGVETTFTKRVCHFGDSITRGLGNLYNLPSQMTQTGIEIFNMGIDGQTAASAYTNRVAQATSLYTAAYGAGNCVAITGFGVNDIRTGRTAAATYTDITNLIAYHKGLGFKAVVRTMTLQVGLSGAQQIEYDALQALIIANTAGADAVADVSGALVVGDLYDGGTHPSSTGQGKLVSIIQAAI